MTGIVCGTGFVKSALALPVIRRLAQTYDVPIEHERIRLKPNCGIPPLDRPDSRLRAMGLSRTRSCRTPTRSPASSTRRRRFVGDCFRAEGIKGRSFPSRLEMQMSPGQRDRQGDPSAPEDRAARVGRENSYYVPHPHRPDPHAHGNHLLGPALLGLILSLVTGHLDWLVLIGVYYVMGIFLDTAIYPWLLQFQPPWMTFCSRSPSSGCCSCSRAPERHVRRTLEHLDRRGDHLLLARWILAIPITKMVLLPLISLTYLESAGEFRQVDWSIPPPLEPLPVLASSAEAKRGPGPVVREASGVHAKPLRRCRARPASTDGPAAAGLRTLACAELSVTDAGGSGADSRRQRRRRRRSSDAR